MARVSALVVGLALVVATASPAYALPSAVADNGVDMVDGPRVDDIVRVGSNTWLGGNFSNVLNGNGVQVAAAPGLTVFDASGTLVGSINGALPKLGGTGRDVYDLSLGGNGVLYAAGKFTYTVGGKNYRNLIGVDPSTGGVVATYSAPALKSVLATSDYVYAGGRKLQRYGLSGGAPSTSWHSMVAYADDTLRAHTMEPAFREIAVASPTELIVVGQFDWIDAMDAAHQKKVAVLVDVTTGAPELGSGSWSINCSCAGESSPAFGHAVEVASGTAYIAAGGNDWVAAVSLTTGTVTWQTDVNGSAQDLALYGLSQLIVGGHFTAIEASGSGDQSGSECPERYALSMDPCWLQPRLAAVSAANGLADTSWRPVVCCLYRGVWATMVDNTTIHVGGEFTKLDDDPGREYYYGRFS